MPEPHLSNHLTWREELLVLTELHIPRCYYTSIHRKRVELHGFCDASEVAYSAVVYLRATYHICLIRRRSRLVAAYNSIGEFNKIVAALE